MDSALLCIVKGDPTPAEVAALVTVLLARAGQQRPPAGSHPTRWRASGVRSRSWDGPASWSPAMRRWDLVR
jgi:hypothetical protein